MTRITRKDVERAASNVGLHVSTYSPGDGVTRYGFSTEPTDWHMTRYGMRALGAKEAYAWIQGYREGKASA